MPVSRTRNKAHVADYIRTMGAIADALRISAGTW